LTNITNRIPHHIKFVAEKRAALAGRNETGRDKEQQ
jgi:hypothetical protein